MSQANPFLITAVKDSPKDRESHADELAVLRQKLHALKEALTRYTMTANDDSDRDWGQSLRYRLEQFNVNLHDTNRLKVVRFMVSKDVTKLVETEGSRSPSDYTLYHIDFTSPSPAAPAPAAPAPVAPAPAAKLVNDERTRKRAPLFTEMEKLKKVEHEFDLALEEFHAASRDLNNAMLEDDDDKVHDMFDILTVRCSVVGRKHKNMLKAVEDIKANMHEVGVMRSDLCRSQYNSYVVCPKK